MVDDISILYVEDDINISVFTSKLLSSKTGFKITHVNNGLKGLNYFKSKPPDIIITDIRMPEMDGITMIKEIRKLDQEVPIIVTTAFGDTENILACVDLGIDAYIVKPISIDKIIKKISRISKRILLKRKVDDLQEQLIHSHRMEAVGQLAGGVAHEFNNILTAIISYSSVIAMKLEDDTLKEYIQKVIVSAEKAADMVRSLLAFSRKDIIQPVPQKLSIILNNILQMLAKSVGSHINIIIHNKDSDVIAMVDSNSIEQVLYHIINNSRESMPDGGEIHVSVDIGSPEGVIMGLQNEDSDNLYAIITIKDDGVGMSKEILSKAFDPFFTTKEVGKGPGLGLSIAYGIVRQHDGYIHLESTVDGGSTVKIFLPLI